LYQLILKYPGVKVDDNLNCNAHKQKLETQLYKPCGILFTLKLYVNASDLFILLLLDPDQTRNGRTASI